MTAYLVTDAGTAWLPRTGGVVLDLGDGVPRRVSDLRAAVRELDARALVCRPPVAGEVVRPAGRRLVTAGEAPTAAATAGAGDYFPPT